MTYPIHPGPFFPGSRNWVSCQTQPLWLNNAAQCRRLTGGYSIATAAWTHEGTYLSYGFLASISDQRIPVEYELDTFNTPPQEQLYVTPKIGYVDAMPYFRSRHLALISPLGHFNGDNARLSPKHQTHKTHGDSKVYFLQRQTWLSLNYGEHNPSHVPRYALLS